MKASVKIAVISTLSLVICAIFIIAGLFLSGPEKIAVKSAKSALLASVDNPESVSILAISKADSVYGRDYVTDEEKADLTMAMMKVNDLVMQKTDNLQNFDPESTEIGELMSRQMTAMSVMRNLLHSGIIQNKDRRFTGWKIKVDFEAVSEYGNKYHSEYWFILDKTGSHVIRSFEIPII